MLKESSKFMARKSLEKSQSLNMDFFCFQTFQALLSEILQVRPVIYTFVLGCGQHSLKQYRVALRKACHEGLREAGLSEDRHASDGAIGKFKSIDDKDCGNPWGVQRCFPIV
jgi:hypothetical protein